MPIIPEDSLQRLIQEHKIILLLNRRNKNQHRVAVWWKHFNILKRHLNKLIIQLTRYQNKPSEKLKSQILVTGRHLKYSVVKKCYWAFNDIVALGQFITVGLTLIGVLARVNHEVNKIEGIDDAKVRTTDIESKGLHEAVNVDVGEEIGEEVDDITQVKIVKEEVIKETDIKKTAKSTIDDLFGVEKKKKKLKVSNERISDVSLSKSTAPVLEKKKKKKKKSAIDDIFG